MGIVASLVTMVAVFLFFMVFLYRAPKAPDTGEVTPNVEHPKEPGTKHAA